MSKICQKCQNDIKNDILFIMGIYYDLVTHIPTILQFTIRISCSVSIIIRF